MKPKTEPAAHKLGANQKEAAVKAQTRDKNFKQSKDVREDRGARQMKNSGTSPIRPR